MDVTVAVCTFGRYAELEDTIASLAAQTYDRGEMNVLVVDNNPEIDRLRHRELIEKFNQSIRIAFVAESRVGVSNARNRAINECATPCIAFLDDDCIASPRWLGALAAAWQHSPSGCIGAVGGRSLGVWNFQMPHWLSRSLLGYLSIIDWGPQSVDIIPPLYLVCGNSMFLVESVREAGGFDLSLGHLGDTLLSNEETELSSRLRRRGYRILYEPDAIVGHTIPRDRASMAWFRRRVFWQAVSDAIQAQAQGVREIPDNAKGSRGKRAIFSKTKAAGHRAFEDELRIIYSQTFAMACGAPGLSGRGTFLGTESAV